jgi:hypothetical protein
MNNKYIKAHKIKGMSFHNTRVLSIYEYYQKNEWAVFPCLENGVDISRLYLLGSDRIWEHTLHKYQPRRRWLEIGHNGGSLTGLLSVVYVLQLSQECM